MKCSIPTQLQFQGSKSQTVLQFQSWSRTMLFQYHATFPFRCMFQYHANIPMYGVGGKLEKRMKKKMQNKQDK